MKTHRFINRQRQREREGGRAREKGNNPQPFSALCWICQSQMSQKLCKIVELRNCTLAAFIHIDSSSLTLSGLRHALKALHCCVASDEAKWRKGIGETAQEN